MPAVLSQGKSVAPLLAADRLAAEHEHDIGSYLVSDSDEEGAEAVDVLAAVHEPGSNANEAEGDADAAATVVTDFIAEMEGLRG